tara:strand:- start:13721 stop:14302 length:582 start_codon:yes stop_codon:yes gene_type:complete
MTKRHKFFKNYFTEAAAPKTTQKICDWAGCSCDAPNRAPKSRDNIYNYLWFCDDHIIDYNKKWDYLKGLTAGEIEREIIADTYWRRPMWPLSRLKKYGPDNLQDPLDFIPGYQGIETKQKTASLPQEIQESIKVMEVDYPLSLQDLKKAYKLKAKEYHPDVNSGSKQAEEKLKLINIAYKILETFLQDGLVAR